jgi:hypothetical protein
LHEKNGAQLYMNRGIGITGFPIRLGARPEISVFELTREASLGSSSSWLRAPGLGFEQLHDNFLE